MRRNARLNGCPALAYVRADDAATRAAAVASGAIVTAGAFEAAALDWLCEAIRADRARRAAERGLEAAAEAMRDPETGLLKPGDMTAHLSTLASTPGAAPLALAILGLSPAAGAEDPSAEAWRSACVEAASMAARLIRPSDSAALIGSTVVIAAPGASSAGARALAHRVASVMEATTGAGGVGAVGPLAFYRGEVRQTPGEDGPALLARALAAA